MASAYHVGAAVLVHVARRRRLDSDLDERSFSFYTEKIVFFQTMFRNERESDSFDKLKRICLKDFGGLP